MRPKTFNKKLVLKKATIVNLNRRQMDVAQGGNVIGVEPEKPVPVSSFWIIVCSPCNPLTDPPTECWTCPYTWNSPCCPQHVETVEPDTGIN